MSYDEAQLPNPMELPSVEQGANIETPTNVDHQGSERNPEYLPPVQSSQNNSPSSGAPQALLSTQDDQQPYQVNAQASQEPSLATNSPSIADDVDLIEKEWVHKAKEIVEKTRDNPYLQNKAISEIKADYIKKRYNKDVSKSEQ